MIIIHLLTPTPSTRTDCPLAPPSQQCGLIVSKPKLCRASIDVLVDRQTLCLTHPPSLPHHHHQVGILLLTDRAYNKDPQHGGVVG